MSTTDDVRTTEALQENANDADKNRTVHLISSEGESFDVPVGEAKMSELVKTMIDGTLFNINVNLFNLRFVFTEDLEEDEAQEIPLPNVKSAILAKVIEFIHHYKAEIMHEIEKVPHLSITFQ